MSTKQFIYFRDTDGGMDVYDRITGPEYFSGPQKLIGWMSKSCRKDDTLLLEWMSTAEIGDYFEHRVGYIVRVNPAPDAETAPAAVGDKHE